VARIRDLRPWIFRAAFRIAAGELKRPPAVPAAETTHSSEEGLVDLLDLFSSLTRAQRRAVVLRDVLGYSTADAASLIGSSEVAVRVHLHAARRRLREQVEEADV
jgi:DNA-directed RNA polymerase specialized sigma24 family protein